MFRKAIVKVLLMLVFFIHGFILGQETYNNCNNAIDLCPNVSLSVNNRGANVTSCPVCEDNFLFCFTPNNTIWLRFETNEEGGEVLINVSNLVFENNPNQGNQIQATLIRAVAPCDATTYTQIGNCITGTGNNFTMFAENLEAETVYYLVINGARNGGAELPAEASMDVVLYGEGVFRVTPLMGNYLESNEICRNEVVTALVFTEFCENLQDFKWFVNDELVAITSDSILKISTLKNGDVLSVSTSCFEKCPVEISYSYPAFVVKSFEVNAGPDFNIKPGESVTLLGSSELDNFYWTPNLFMTSPHTLEPIVSPTSTITYSLVSEDEGCVFSDQVTVFVEKPFEITNTFTPNGDGVNDTWKIPSIEDFPNNLMQIYDRWGQLVFQTTGYSSQKEWDGTSKKGKNLSPGTYFFTLDLRDPLYSEPIIGTITLIR
jgi:gliding motility-associated-like protein